jgi:acyl dehydratase
MAITVTKENAEDYLNQEVGVSDWLKIEQGRINAFADATNDHQFIHIDPDAAAQTPFGTTIAHGFLTLSLLTDLAATNGIQLDNTEMLVNYGMNKVRFLAPVKVNDEIRARVILKGFEEKRPQQFLITLEVTIEIKGQDKPALITDWITMAITGGATS